MKYWKIASVILSAPVGVYLTLAAIHRSWKV